MLLTFRQVLMQPHVVDIMRCIKRVVSIGCGPGPDIAAVLMILRNNIGVQHFIKVIGIDQFIGWRQYVISLNKVDLNGSKNSIEFWQLRVEEGTLDKVLSAEMCVMSYTDAAIHTLKFWQGLKQKFSLIVILDQKKGSLTRLLRREHFRMVEYEYKGTKRFFYWVDPRGVKESLAHVVAKGTRLGELNCKTGLKESIGDSGPVIRSVKSEVEGECSGDGEEEKEEREEEEEDDGEDDNSEQQRELAAIFDRLGDIGKMPVAQLNELSEVEKIRSELLRSNDSGSGGHRLSEPKESYVKALEPQKNLSKERKNQLLKAKLRELGVGSDDDEDDDDDDEDDDDNEEAGEGEDVEEKEVEEKETGSSTDRDPNEYDKVDDYLDTKYLGTEDPALSFITDDHSLEPPQQLDLTLPIISGLDDVIPNKKRHIPAYSPPIIVPPMQLASTEALYGAASPSCYSPLSLSVTFPTSLPLMEQQLSPVDPHSLPTYERTVESFRINDAIVSSPPQNILSKRSPSLVLLSSSEELPRTPEEQPPLRSSALRKRRRSPGVNFVEQKRKIPALSSIVNSVPSDKTKVTDLREVLNDLRRKKNTTS